MALPTQSQLNLHRAFMGFSLVDESSTSNSIYVAFLQYPRFVFVTTGEYNFKLITLLF